MNVQKKMPPIHLGWQMLTQQMEINDAKAVFFSDQPRLPERLPRFWLWLLSV